MQTIAKRKRWVPADEVGAGRRQPMTSCDFCRLKKLKCDRLVPCSSCATRGIECHGQPNLPAQVGSGPISASVAAATSGSNVNHDVLFRIRRLEQAVFGQGRGDLTDLNRNKGLGDAVTLQQPVAGVQKPTRQESDVVNIRPRDDPSYRDHSSSFTFSIKRPRGGSDTSQTNGTPPQVEGLEAPRTVSLPPREEAFALLDDYVDNSLALSRIVSETSVRSLIRDVYSRLAQGQPVSNDQVALSLAVCADSAFYWNQVPRKNIIFESEEMAARQSYRWRIMVWELLDHSQRAGASSLEGIQARMILQDMIYSLEGSSARWRYLLSSNLAGARELFLHLIDCPAYENKEDAATREIKRRVWWHLVGTDWLSSSVSGPLDRTYATSPQQMAVHYPRNINDQDLPLCDHQPSHPIETATDMSHFIARIRLAEMCREIADILTMGTPGVTTDLDHLRFEQVLRIDRLTEEVRDLFPPPCALDAPLTPDAPSQLRLQRQVIHLSLEARRARLFRPFVQSDIPDRDRRFLRFRTACLRSARAVMDIALEYLATVVDAPLPPGHGGPARDSQKVRPPLPRYSAIVIIHLFQACVVMAADPGLGGDSPSRLPQAQAHREALTKSSNLLERVSEQSPMAAELVGKLIRVLKRYCISDVHTGASGHVGQDVGYPLTTTAAAATAAAAAAALNGQATQLTSVVEYHAPAKSVASAPPALSGQEGAGAPWAGLDLGGFGGLWENLMGNSSANDDWGQVFTDLDHFSGSL